MPIPVAMLQEARRPLRDRVLDFLRKNPSQAYNSAEIVVGLEGWSELAAALATTLLRKEAPALTSVEEALRMLESEGLLQSAEHFNLHYYAIRSS